jgi:anti-anti-sigma factor
MEEGGSRMALALHTGKAARAGKEILTWKAVEISGRNAENFREWILREMNWTGRRVVVDLSAVNYINAAGLAAMVQVNRLATNNGISIEWRIIDRNVRMLVRLTRLDSILNISQPVPRRASTWRR